MPLPSALTGPCKLMRYWIQGLKANTSEPLIDLPGYPDNVRPDGKGGYWVALYWEKYELLFGLDRRLLLESAPKVKSDKR